MYSRIMRPSPRKEETVMNWKQRQREKGWKDIMVWLSPEAVKALGETVEKTGRKKQAIINEALLAHVYGKPGDESSSDLESRVIALETRVERLERPQDKAIEDISAKREEGKSYRRIAEELNEEGAPLPPESKSNEWTKSIVEKYFKKAGDSGATP
jgi:hypothetical protein